MSSTRQKLRNRALEALADAIEHGCKVVKKQLDDRSWGWADRAADVVDSLVETFASLEGEVGQDGGHPDAITGGLTVPVAPSEINQPCADVNCSLVSGHPGQHYDERDGVSW